MIPGTVTLPGDTSLIGPQPNARSASILQASQKMFTTYFKIERTGKTGIASTTPKTALIPPNVTSGKKLIRHTANKQALIIHLKPEQRLNPHTSSMCVSFAAKWLGTSIDKTLIKYAANRPDCAE